MRGTNKIPAFDPKTLSFYAKEAPVYVASGPGGRSRHLDGFLERLPSNAHILELGCGGGTDSAHMLSRGFEVEPTDGVPEIARQAAERLQRTVKVMRFEELDACARYDAVWASACLLHVPRPSLPPILSLIWRALKPGGWHFASYKGGGVEGRDRFNRYFNYMTLDDLKHAYTRDLTWSSIELNGYEGGGYDGRKGPWVSVTARKPSSQSK